MHRKLSPLSPCCEYIPLWEYVNSFFMWRGSPTEVQGYLIGRAIVTIARGDEDVGALKNPRRRPVQWSAPDQSRTADGTALGCVVPRWPSALGYWPAAASHCAFGIRRGIRRSRARCGLRDRRERPARRFAGIVGSGR